GYYLAHIEKYKIGLLIINKLHKKIGNSNVLSYGKLCFITLIVIAVSTTIFGTYFESMKKGKLSEIFYDRLSINVVFATIGIFLFIKYCKLANKYVLNIINFVCKYSYGIYLVHMLVLFYLGHWGMDAYFINPLIGIPTTTILCIGISTGIIFVVNKIPFIGKHISG
ncbi:MAG: acyltransferase family protein, partial [Bacteroidales bacterium]|nr:acyltransferase family protein [Bacteroidales bacterium]